MLDATSQATAVANGEASPSELLEQAIANADRVGEDINAVISPIYDRARELAAGELPMGPFRGVPFLTKDLGATVAGDPSHSGMQLLKDARNTAGVDTHLGLAFKHAGLVNFGRTNTPELGLCPTTEPVCYGATRNPWDLSRSSGGSSGGSAAAVAARVVPVAHGSDGGGSLRIPASCCGVVGLKPTRARLSGAPLVGEGWHGFATEGVIGLSIRDIAAFMDLMSGYVPGDPYTALPPRTTFLAALDQPLGPQRIAVMTQRPWQSGALHSDCLAAVKHAAGLLEGLGHQIEETVPPAYTESNLLDLFFTVVEAHSAATLNLIGSLTRTDIGPEHVEPYTWFCANNGRSVSAADYVGAIDQIHLWARRMAEIWNNYDVLLTPTLGEPPTLLGDLAGSAPDVDNTRARTVISSRSRPRRTPRAIPRFPCRCTGMNRGCRSGCSSWRYRAKRRSCYS